MLLLEDAFICQLLYKDYNPFEVLRPKLLEEKRSFTS